MCELAREFLWDSYVPALSPVSKPYARLPIIHARPFG